MKSETGFTPHITVGQATEVVRTRNMENFRKEYQPIKWTVTEVCLIAREGDQPFEVKYTIPLGQTNTTGHDFVSAQESESKNGNDVRIMASGPQTDFDRVVTKVSKWLQGLAHEKRPKSLEKLEKSMQPLCRYQVSEMSVEEAEAYLREEGYLEVQLDGKLKYLNSPQTNSHYNANSRTEPNEIQAVRTRLRAWVTQPKNEPKTRDKLHNCLYHLTLSKRSIPTQDVVLELQEQGLITMKEGNGWEQATLVYNF
eukprot:TRINITY_DN6030_c0_g1_i2.p1 TRINITY_DN6030_c0_g1~~TRINITY_DN6030_c0_g1_i2.p1  ORF type:complete len:254 (-),score=35.47 TRINITY_DN6030_c0_g1_i2:49-810(-)